MDTTSASIQCRALAQQGYDYSPAELAELSWGLRFTPSVCMLLAIYGLVTQTAWVNLALAAIGIVPFWLPAWHPFDRLYNHLLRPLWNGVALPPNPLPRRIACVMGGSMNLGIGLAFLYGNAPLAYGFGVVLVTLQLVVISTHFCVASWMYEGILRMVGRWTPPLSVERAKQLVAAGARLVDVREPDEFARGHIPGAVNIPLGRIEEHADELRGGEVILCCQSGLRSQRALQLLRKKRVGRVHDLGALGRWS